MGGKRGFQSLIRPVFELLEPRLLLTTTCYVATTGVDSGAGSGSSPWQTVGYALSRVSGGDTIVVRDGVYNAGITTSRSFSDWVTVKAEHPYLARLTNIHNDVGATVLSIYTPGSAKIIVEGFVISNKDPDYVPAARESDYLIHIQDAQDVTLRDNVIFGNNAPNCCNELLKINRGGDPYYPRNIKIQGNVFYDGVSAPGADMIDSVRPGELDITDNIFFERSAPNAQSFITLKTEVNAASLGVTPRSPRYVIARNIFMSWDGRSDQAFVQFGEDGDAQYMITDALVENNLLLGNSANLIAAPFQLKGVKGVTVRANTIAGDLPGGAYGFRIGTEGSNPQVKDISIYNNIWSDPTGTMGTRLVNTYGSVDASTIRLDHNLYWNNGSSLPASGTPKPTNDAHRVVANPLLQTDQSGIVAPVWDETSGRFISGSRTIREEFVRLVTSYGALSLNSPGVNAADPANMPATDILGRPRDASPDSGAYEYIAPNRLGDSNGDGKVDGADLALWQQHYDPTGEGAGTYAMGDWNSDGKIDGGDLALWQQNYNPIGITSEPAAQPLVSSPASSETSPLVALADGGPAAPLLASGLFGSGHFIDPFDGIAVDHSDWTVSDNETIVGGNWASESNISVSGGVARFTMSNDSDPDHPVRGAQVRTINLMTDGTYMVRMRAEAGTGATTAFFSYLARPDQGLDGNNLQEIDVEVFGETPGEVHFTVWYSDPSVNGGSGEGKRLTASVAVDTTQWHVYAFERRADRLVFLVDGAAQSLRLQYVGPGGSGWLYSPATYQTSIRPQDFAAVPGWGVSYLPNLPAPVYLNAWVHQWGGTPFTGSRTAEFDYAAAVMPGDANLDTKVDGGDLALWQQNYDPLGLNQNAPGKGDFNGDGKVDGGDLALWQQNYDPIGITSAPDPQPLAAASTDAAGQGTQTDDPIRAQDLTYSVADVTDGSQVEHRLFLGTQHFLTAIEGGGIFDLRAHPGVDINGWGTSWYMQPFLPAATLGHTTTQTVTAAADHIDVSASGYVSKGASDTFGTWTFTMAFTYDPAAKEVSGAGSYGIVLDGALTDDLNLCRIASNYLDDVPLLGGGGGDTGDMQSAAVDGGDFQFSWNPPLQPSHYPTDETDSLSVNAVGRLNTVDTAAQGLAPIQPAYKPGVTVVLTSGQPGAPMTFGGQYTVSAAKDSKADNVGITPLILKKSTLTTYTFGVTFTSTPLSQDGTDINRDGKVDGGDLAIWQQNYDPLGVHANTPPMGDCNADGRIDGGDLALWQQHYNPIGILSLSGAQPLVSKAQPAGTLPASAPVAADAPALGTPAALDVATPEPVLLAEELAPRAQWGSTVTHSELPRTPAPAQPDDALGLLDPLQFEPLLT